MTLLARYSDSLWLYEVAGQVQGESRYWRRLIDIFEFPLENKIRGEFRIMSQSQIQGLEDKRIGLITTILS